MGKKAPKYYVVWKGLKPGIYGTWAECQKQIQEFAGALFKAFPTKALAENAFHDDAWNYIGKSKKAQKQPPLFAADAEANLESWSVDAACSGNPGDMEYQCVHTGTGKQIFRCGPISNATNNIGEFLAIAQALELLKKTKCDLPVYSDSQVAMGWIKAKKAKTTLNSDETNQKVFELIERAEDWLKTNDYSTKILKWDTENWGEIPADFGRK
jgi:ribonuclease HI